MVAFDNSELDRFKGLVLKAAPGVAVELFAGFQDGEAVAAHAVVETESGTCHVYPDLVGAFRCEVRGEGYYTVTKNILMTEEKRRTRTEVDVTPGKMAGTGWEPQELRTYTDEVITAHLSDDLSQWPAYAEVFASPYFTQPHALHQITTQAQLEAFLKGLEIPVYSTGTSGIHGHDIPIAILTRADLSHATTLAQAAQAMGHDKPIVLIRAQMHGKEPAPGEAALAMIKWLAGPLGDQLLDRINVCIIPRQNPDGAQDFVRTVGDGIDPNRDNLELRSQEITAFARARRLLKPEVIIDGHEYTVKSRETRIPAGDILAQTGFTLDNTENFKKVNLELLKAVFAGAEKNGLTSRYYNKCANSVNPSISGGNTTKQGILYILLETPGIAGGLNCYARRIMAQISSMEAILRYVAEHPALIRSTVAAERQNIMEKGAKYDPENIVTLDITTEEVPALRRPVWVIDQLTGEAEEELFTPITYTALLRSRVAPTAYVIPAGEAFAEPVLELMDKHGIGYTFLPEGSTVLLQQYSEHADDLLMAERAVTFPDGAWVFCKNQVGGILLSMLMEPDVDIKARHNKAILQEHMTPPVDGVYPLYRYIHDLNADGFIDYR